MSGRNGSLPGSGGVFTRSMISFGSSSVYPNGPRRPMISNRMIANAYTSPFWLPSRSSRISFMISREISFRRENFSSLMRTTTFRKRAVGVNTWFEQRDPNDWALARLSCGMLIVMTPAQKSISASTPAITIDMMWVSSFMQCSFMKPQDGSSIGRSEPAHLSSAQAYSFTESYR
uniref:Uncharacterized protein n=1 Tax=Anopheles atroparvus TaxID=41427 RepID=A0A182JJV6_ANOAO